MPATTAEFPAANIPGAALRFPADQYVTLPNVPVFREHQTKAVDGRTLKFGMQELQAVANRCNRRIAETGDYAAVVIGHTPDPADGEAPQPELVGYAGPFRLGTIGEGERKCWAILADFHTQRGDLAKVRKQRRRSPELCLEDGYEEMFLDPIALLGAECPRLDLRLMTGAPGSDGAALGSEPEQAKHLNSFLRNGKDHPREADGEFAEKGQGAMMSSGKEVLAANAEAQAITSPLLPRLRLPHAHSGCCILSPIRLEYRSNRRLPPFRENYGKIPFSLSGIGVGRSIASRKVCGR